MDNPEPPVPPDNGVENTGVSSGSLPIEQVNYTFAFSATFSAEIGLNFGWVIYEEL